MLKNFFQLAIRNLLKSKATSIINILGFSLGITCCLIIYFKVKYEFSFDKFHTHTENTYRVVRQYKSFDLNPDNRVWEYGSGVEGAVPDEIRKDIPEAKMVTVVYNGYDDLVKVPDAHAYGGVQAYKLEEGTAFVDPLFFKVFDFENTGFRWVDGDRDRALSEPNCIVISQDEANKYFHGQNPMGKTITLFDEVDFKVTGVIAGLPANTYFSHKLFASYATFDVIRKGFRQDWENIENNQCFVTLVNASQKEIVEEKITRIYVRHAGRELKDFYFKLQPVKEIHTNTSISHGRDHLISKDTLLALICIGLFIMISASINYANLALARSRLRTREVGIRKVFGSKRIYIVAQFLGESFIITLIALNIGVLCSKLILALSPAFLGIPAEYHASFDGLAILFTIGLLIVISIISGSYPALVVSGFKPIDILKNRFIISRSGKLNFTRSMVVLQFSISLIMIIATIVLLKQLRFLDKIDKGYNTDAVFTVNVPNQDLNRMNRLKAELLKNPLVKHVSLSSNDPAHVRNWTGIYRFSNNEKKGVVTQILFIDSSYLDTYQLNLIAGKNISTADSGRSILVNQQFIHDLEFKKADEAIGTLVNLDYKTPVPLIIAGVVRDYHYETLRKKIRPTILVGKQDYVDVEGIKLSLNAKNKQEANAQLKSVLQFTREKWESIYPEYLYEPTFLEDRLKSYYRNDQITSKLLNIFSFITIFIGCLGIFGLAFYTTEQKSKEIAVRKVSGASTGVILGILSKNYAIWLGIAFVIACPVAYYFMHKWLEGFAYKTSFDWWIYALAGLITLVVAGITVSWQSYKAAMTNPVDALKHE